MKDYIVVVQALEMVQAESAEKAQELALKEAIKHADMDLEAGSWVIVG